MFEFIESVIPEVVGGLLALACAVVGAKMATSASKESSRREELIDAYARVFAAFYERMAHDNDPDVVVRSVTAIERACLICSPKVETLLRDALPIVAKVELDMERLAPIILSLRKETKRDIENTYRKHDCAHNKKE